MNRFFVLAPFPFCFIFFESSTVNRGLCFIVFVLYPLSLRYFMSSSGLSFIFVIVIILLHFLFIGHIGEV